MGILKEEIEDMLPLKFEFANVVKKKAIEYFHRSVYGLWLSLQQILVQQY